MLLPAGDDCIGAAALVAAAAGGGGGGGGEQDGYKREGGEDGGGRESRERGAGAEGRRQTQFVTLVAEKTFCVAPFDSFAVRRKTTADYW